MAILRYAGCHDPDIRYDHVCVRNRFDLGESMRRSVAAGGDPTAADQSRVHLLAVWSARACDHPQAGTYHYGVDLPAPPGASIVATAPGSVIRIQKKGPGGLEILVQHDGFVAIYSHLGMAAPSFAQGKEPSWRARSSVLLEERSHCGTHVYFEMDFAGKPVDPAPYTGNTPMQS